MKNKKRVFTEEQSAQEQLYREKQIVNQYKKPQDDTQPDNSISSLCINCNPIARSNPIVREPISVIFQHALIYGIFSIIIIGGILELNYQVVLLSSLFLTGYYFVYKKITLICDKCGSKIVLKKAKNTTRNTPTPQGDQPGQPIIMQNNMGQQAPITNSYSRKNMCPKCNSQMEVQMYHNKKRRGLIGSATNVGLLASGIFSFIPVFNLFRGKKYKLFKYKLCKSCGYSKKV